MLVDDSHEFISTYAIRCFTLGIVITFGNWNRPRLDLTYWEEFFFGFHFTLTRKMLPPTVDGVIKLHKWHNVGADPNITMVRWKGQIYLTRVHAIVNFILTFFLVFDLYTQTLQLDWATILELAEKIISLGRFHGASVSARCRARSSLFLLLSSHRYMM